MRRLIKYNLDYKPEEEVKEEPMGVPPTKEELGLFLKDHPLNQYIKPKKYSADNLPGYRRK